MQVGRYLQAMLEAMARRGRDKHCRLQGQDQGVSAGGRRSTMSAPTVSDSVFLSSCLPLLLPPVPQPSLLLRSARVGRGPAPRQVARLHSRQLLLERAKQAADQHYYDLVEGARVRHQER